MDIIASHQSGLIEQIEAEAVALAGRPREAVQRAIVCHHVADLLGMAHGYALLAAQGALALDEALERMERQARRWRWRMSRAERADLAERVALFAEALRRIDAERCVGVLMAYRLIATPGLGGEAAKRLDPRLFAALSAAQAARGSAGGDQRRALFEAHRNWAEAAFGARIEAAVEELRWPLGQAAVRSAVAALLIAARDHDRIANRLDRFEARLRASKRLPEGFAANPAQAFFTLQRQVVERRRSGAIGDMPSPDDAVRLAA